MISEHSQRASPATNPARYSAVSASVLTQPSWTWIRANVTLGVSVVRPSVRVPAAQQRLEVIQVQRAGRPAEHGRALAGVGGDDCGRVKLVALQCVGEVGDVPLIELVVIQPGHPFEGVARAT